MAAVTQRIHSEQDYLQSEDFVNFRREYYNGLVVVMAGGTLNHNRIKENLSVEIGICLKRRKYCRSYSSDQRISIPENLIYLYPDYVIVCGPNEYSPIDKNSIINPTVIIEVTSKSTESHDIRTKFKYYQEIESLQEYILIDSLTYRVIGYNRIDENSWERIFCKSKLADEITILSIDATFLLSDLYDGADLKEGWAVRKE